MSASTSIFTFTITVWLWTFSHGFGSMADEDQVPICSSIKCSCNHTFKTVSCRGLVFEYLPVFPEWTETLQLNGNHLTLLKDNALDGLISLRRLYMSYSGLEYIESGAFKSLAQLRVLDLSHNRLYYWPSDTLEPLTKLKVLNLSGNAFDDITIFTKLLPFEGNQLDELILGDNQFLRKSADFVRVPPTRRLDLSESRLSVISGRTLTLLPGDERRLNQTVRMDALAQADHLDLYGCGAVLDSSFFDEVHDVIELNIGANAVNTTEVIASKLRGYPRLESFNASRLKADVGVTTWDTFPPTLKSLDLSYWSLHSISFGSLPSPSRVHTLYLSGNRLQTVHLPTSLSNLRRLRLDSNQMTEFPTFENGAKFESLEHLDLSGNLITNIDQVSLGAYPSLKVLLLAHNRIVTIHPSAFSKCCMRTLGILDLSHNSIEKLPSLVFWSLRDLDLGSNRLLHIGNGTMAWSTNLERLDLSCNTDLMSSQRLFTCNGDYGEDPVQYPSERYCSLASLWLDELTSLAKLRELSVRGVGLTSVPHGQFSKLLSRLEHLDLSENLITSDQWEPLASSIPSRQCIRTLNLRRNRLTTLKNLTVFRSDCLERLDLKENPFDCDCQLEPLFGILKSLPDSEREVYNESLYYCFSPSNYYRYPLYEFASNLQPCSYYESSQSGASAGGLRAILATFLGLVALVLMAVFCRACLGSAIRYGFNIRQRMYKPLRVIISGTGTNSEMSSPIML